MNFQQNINTEKWPQKKYNFFTIIVEVLGKMIKLYY